MILRHEALSLLGLSAPFDDRILRKAYADAVKRFRPDDHPEEFQRIREAYEFLKSPQAGIDFHPQEVPDFSIPPPPLPMEKPSFMKRLAACASNPALLIENDPFQEFPEPIAMALMVHTYPVNDPEAVPSLEAAWLQRYEALPLRILNRIDWAKHPDVLEQDLYRAWGLRTHWLAWEYLRRPPDDADSNLINLLEERLPLDTQAPLDLCLLDVLEAAKEGSRPEPAFCSWMQALLARWEEGFPAPIPRGPDESAAHSAVAVYLEELLGAILSDVPVGMAMDPNDPLRTGTPSIALWRRALPSISPYFVPYQAVCFLKGVAVVMGIFGLLILGCMGLYWSVFHLQALRLITPFLVSCTIVITSVRPFLAKRGARGKPFHRRLLKIWAALSVVGIPLALLSPENPLIILECISVTVSLCVVVILRGRHGFPSMAPLFAPPPFHPSARDATCILRKLCDRLGCSPAVALRWLRMVSGQDTAWLSHWGVKGILFTPNPTTLKGLWLGLAHGSALAEVANEHLGRRPLHPLEFLSDPDEDAG